MMHGDPVIISIIVPIYYMTMTEITSAAREHGESLFTMNMMNGFAARAARTIVYGRAPKHYNRTS